MKKILHITGLFNLFFMIALFTACEKEVVIELEEKEQKLAILCNFTPGEPFNLKLSKSQSLNAANDNSSIVVDDYDIEICSEDSNCEQILPLGNSSNTDARFQSVSLFPQTSKKYTLKITVPGQKQPITAESSVPVPVELSHTTVGSITSYEHNDIMRRYDVRLSLQFLDPFEEDNYYQVNFYQVLVNHNGATTPDSLVTISPSIGFSYFDDKLVRNFNALDGGLLFKDATFEFPLQDFTFEPIFEYTHAASTPKEIIIELRTVSKEYYDYYSSIYRQSSQESTPFSDATIIYSNITNGLGVFAGFSKDRVRSEIEL